MTSRASIIKEYTSHQALPKRTFRKGSDDFSRLLEKAEKIRDGSNPPGNIYTIRSGDTLYGIAKQLKTKHNLLLTPNTIVRELTALNKLSNPNRIYPGQTLHIPPCFTNVSAAPKAGTTPVLSPVTASPVSADPSRPPLLPLNVFTMQPLYQREEVAINSPSEPMGQNGPPMAATPPAATGGQPKDLAAQIAMYKEDQLLAHPGGDNYFLNRTANVYDESFDQGKFTNRVNKDLSDAGENLINMAKDFALGSQYKHVGKDGKIFESQRVGLLGTVKNFFEDLLSGVSLGAYMPGNEKASKGIGPSLFHFFKKVFYEAPVKDLLVGVPHAGINIFKDAAFAAINLLEVVPDATIGNFEWGQKATTTIFDNGQVAVDYFTDIIPSGNAWLRVNAAGADGELAPPVLFSLQTSEQGITDSRWATVRNTPFRKTIETVGSLLSDAFIALSATTQVHTPSAKHQDKL